MRLWDDFFVVQAQTRIKEMTQYFLVGVNLIKTRANYNLLTRGLNEI